jgi:hypothetical protein
MFSMLTFIGCRENVHIAQELTCHSGFQYDFTESQAASSQHFQLRNRRFSVFEAGYWKDFQNW